MFKKKQTPIERRRPALPTEQSRPAVFSYHAYRTERSDELAPTRDMAKADDVLLLRRKKQRLRFWRNARATGVVLAVALFLALDMALNTTPKVVITGDSSGRVFLRDSSVYAGAVHDLLASSIFAHNKLTINATRITDGLLRQFPELKAASISLPVIGTRPVVYVQPAQPKLVLVTQSSGSFLLDNSGRALMQATQAANPGALHLPTVTDQSGYNVSVGQTALTSADVTFISQVAGQFSAKGVTVTSMVLPPATSELDVHVAGAAYMIKCNLADSDARAEAGTYLSVRQYLAAHNQTPAAYVDVRVPGRAYYK